MKTITLETAFHRNEHRLLLIFAYDAVLIKKVKSIQDARWSQTRRCWHVPVDSVNLDDLRNLFVGVQLDYKKIDSHSCMGNHPEFSIPVYIDEQKNIFYCSIPFELKDQFKKLEGSWWHVGARTWSAINTRENQEQLERLALTGGYSISYKIKELKTLPTLPSRNLKAVEEIGPDPRFERLMLLQGKKESTIKQYKSYVTWFLSENIGVDFRDNTTEQIQKFIHEKVIIQHFGQSQQNGVISALKLYFLAVYNRELNTDDIPRPKRERPLPKVISVEEFLKMVSVTKNQKHKLILLLLYGCGLRRGELCLLRIEDVDFDREMLYIKGKGNKYRAVNPGKTLLVYISKYIKSYLPDYYLIEGLDKKPYSGTSVGIIVRRAAKHAGIQRRVHTHMLRHSFATHHMERGIELRLIQETLGHASSKTTEIYTYVSRKSIKKMPNLLDELKI